MFDFGSAKRLVDLFHNGVCSNKLFDALIDSLARLLHKEHIEQLNQLSIELVHDSDLIDSKIRDDLVKLKLADKVYIQGKFEYTVCSFYGGHVLESLKNIEAINV